MTCKEKPNAREKSHPSADGCGRVRAHIRSARTPKKTIQHVPMKPTSPVSGKEMYTNYCAVCHGTEGKGNGPAAEALKTPPSDLTVLSKKNGGKYPALKVGVRHSR